MYVLDWKTKGMIFEKTIITGSYHIKITFSSVFYVVRHLAALCYYSLKLSQNSDLVSHVSAKYLERSSVFWFGLLQNKYHILGNHPLENEIQTKQSQI